MTNNVAGPGAQNVGHHDNIRVQRYCPSTGGRPAYDIDSEDLSILVDEGYAVSKIADIYGVSLQTIYRRLDEFDLKPLKSIEDHALLEGHVVLILSLGY